MNTYTDRDGVTFAVLTPHYKDMYADLVEAITIARHYQNHCERLEAMLENAADICHELDEDKADLVRERDKWRDLYTNAVPWP